jgi:hypothetical protein
MAEIIPAHVWQASVAEQRFEVAGDDVLGVYRRADGGDEHYMPALIAFCSFGAMPSAISFPHSSCVAPLFFARWCNHQV